MEKKISKIEKSLDEILSDPMFSYINPESTKKMSEVVRDVFPNVSRNEIGACLAMYWEENDTPESLYKKLMESKVA